MTSIHRALNREMIAVNTGWKIQFEESCEGTRRGPEARNSILAGLEGTHSGGARHLRRSRVRAVFLCDAVRTPIGRYGGASGEVRTDDLAAAFRFANWSGESGCGLVRWTM